MKLSRLNITLTIAALVCLTAMPASSQDKGNMTEVPPAPAAPVEAAVQADVPAPAPTAMPASVAAPAPVPAPAPEASTQAKEVAIYGEVQAVNTAASLLSVQYYDYDSDSEKTADIIVAAGAKLENVAALDDVKKGDWVDVTYVPQDGKNEARVVTVEKEESPLPEEVSTEPQAQEANLPPEQ